MLKQLSQRQGSRLFRKLQRHPNRLVMGTAGLTLVLFAPLAWMAGQSYSSFNNIQQREFRLRQLSDKITYYDEILTTSAWLKVTTGDQRWGDRYDKFEPELEKILARAKQVAEVAQIDDSEVKTDEANTKLAELEAKAFQLLDDGQQQAAIDLLNSAEYARWKALHRSGVKQRNAQVQRHLEDKVKEYRYLLLVSIGITGASMILLIPAWGLVLNLLRRYIEELNQNREALEATNHNLEDLVEQRSQELTQRNKQLETALDELQDTQAQLVQSAKMSSLGQLVAGIAHEINNPVNFIHGNLKHVDNYSQDLLTVVETYAPDDSTAQAQLEDLKEEYDFEFIQEDLPKILQSMKTGTDRIREIVLSLRNFSRLDEAALKRVNLHEGIESTLMILHHSLAHNAQNLPITINKAYGNLPPVVCYPGLINQVLMNVLSNAVDAIEGNNADNPPCIMITTCSDNDCVRIGITDNGVGISEEAHKSLFNPFFTTKPVGKGTGLGMSISYKIITEQHGGRIWAESTIGNGATFWIEIPQRQSELDADNRP